MAADELVVVIQSHQFIEDTVEQLLMVSAGQISSANRTLKKHIAHQN